MGKPPRAELELLGAKASLLRQSRRCCACFHTEHTATETAQAAIEDQVLAQDLQAGGMQIVAKLTKGGIGGGSGSGGIGTVAAVVIGGLGLGALINRCCEGTKPAHGPHWYAYWETGGRRRSRMHKRYIGKASATASPEKLRAIFELRQQRRAEAAERKRRRDTRSHTGSSTSGDRSEPGETPERAAAQAGAQARARLAAQAAQAARAAMTAAATTAPKTIRSLGADPHR